MANTGDKVTALTSDSDRQNTSGTTASTTYTATLTGGTACSRVFVAPASGAVKIDNNCNMFNSGAAHGFCSVQVRLGGTVGSGAVMHAVADADATVSLGTGANRSGVSTRVSGLTPGSTYNVQQLFHVDAGTGTFNNKHLIVQDLP